MRFFGEQTFDNAVRTGNERVSVYETQVRFFWKDEFAEGLRNVFQDQYSIIATQWITLALVC